MTHRGLPADYDAWKTRSDRDDDFWWNEPEPESEDDMGEPADIAVLVERLRDPYLRGSEDFPSPLEAADTLEALQAEIERLQELTANVPGLVARAERAEAEIERLRVEVKALSDLHEERDRYVKDQTDEIERLLIEVDGYRMTLAEQDAEIERLKAELANEVDLSEMRLRRIQKADVKNLNERKP